MSAQPFTSFSQVGPAIEAGDTQSSSASGSKEVGRGKADRAPSGRGKSRLRTHRLRMLSDSATQLLQARDSDGEVLPALFEGLRGELSVDPTFGYVVAELEQGLRLGMADGLDKKLIERCVRLDLRQAVCGFAGSSGQPLHVPDAQSSQDPRAELVRGLGITAYGCEPIITGCRPIGILSFWSRTRHSFEEEDLAFFRLVARHVALARERSLDGAAAECTERELRHRMRNLLSNVQAVAAISARSAESMDKFVHSLSDRIVALGRIQDMLAGGGGAFDLEELLSSQLSDCRKEAVRLEGPAIAVTPEVAVPLGMAIHELKANAMEFGSLSSAEGLLMLRWGAEDDNSGERIRLEWHERSGPPGVEPSRSGFGTKLLDGLLGHQFQVERRFEPEGLTATIAIDLSIS